MALADVHAAAGRGDAAQRVLRRHLDTYAAPHTGVQGVGLP